MMNDRDLSAGAACRGGPPGGRNTPQNAWGMSHGGGMNSMGAMTGTPGMNNMGSMNGMPGMGAMNDMNGMADLYGNVPAGSSAAPGHVAAPGESGTHMMDLSTGLSADALENPATVEETRLGSLRSMLMKIVGHYVVASFLIGTEEAVSWEGFLYSVGNDYIVIFQPDIGRYVTGDLYSLKFVEFYNEKGTMPSCIGNRRRDAYGGRW